MNGDYFDFFHYINTYMKDLKRGESIAVPCPDCGSVMKISRTQDNGHLWVICPVCGVKLSS